MKKTLINYTGLLGVVSLLSYTTAVLFAPMAYPNYNWAAQAVSDLSAANAPSLALWNQLSALYNTYAYRNLDSDTLGYLNTLWENLKIS